MTRRCFITLRTPDSPQSVDVELPEDQPISRLLPDLLKVMGWPQPSRELKIGYRLTTEDGRPVASQDTLASLNINNFENIWISTIQPEQSGELLVPGAESQSESPSGLQSPEERRTPPQSPVTVEVNLIDQPCLVSESGVIFILGQPPITIGRPSGELKPAIDLSELDINQRSSRQHAVIQRKGSTYELEAKRTVNGTFINGLELTAGQSHPLQDKDVIQFGFSGVKLTFRLPKK